MNFTAKEALAIIDKMAAESSRIVKEQFLAELASHDLGRFILKYTYDPMITYGISAPDYAKRSRLPVEFDVESMTLILNQLAHREVTGNAAIEMITGVLSALDEEGAQILFKILDRDLKCGIAETMINMVVPGLLPIFSVMRAHAYQEKKIKKWPWFGEPKLDGMRCTFVCKDGNGGFFSRSGKRWAALDHLVEPIIKVAMAACQSDEKLRTVMDPNSVGNRSAISFVADGEVMTGLFATTGKVRGNEKSEEAEIHLFDFMALADFDVVGAAGKSYINRRSDLERFVAIARQQNEAKLQILPRFYLNSNDEVQAFFEKCLNWTLASYLARGDAQREKELLAQTLDKETGKPKCLEGAIVKNPDGLYEKKKGFTWMKLKAEETEDLPIVGAFPGEPGTKYADCMGGVIVERPNGVRVAVGGGWSDQEREDLWVDWLHDEKANTLSSGAAYKLLGRLIEVKFHEVTPDGSLRHPRKIRFRDDKAGEVDKVAA